MWGSCNKDKWLSPSVLCDVRRLNFEPLVARVRAPGTHWGRHSSFLPAMTSDLAVKAGRKLFERHLKDYEPADPLYETYTDKKGRERRRKVRAAPLASG